LSERLNDFADLALVLEQLDLTISVDTSVIHLAGALGCPVWTLLAYASDWRWLLRTEKSPWYPTMTLFRQTREGAWSELIENVERALRRELQKRA